MRNQRYLPVLAFIMMFFVSQCGDSNSNRIGTLNKVTGKLTFQGSKVTSRVAVVAKIQNGKIYKASIDPQTGRFEVNLPKGLTSSISVIDDSGKVVKLKFQKNKIASHTMPGKNFTQQIPDKKFQTKDSRVDLGNVDLAEGEDDGSVEVGDDSDETSPYEKIDSDEDGTMDSDDPDDDNNGIDDSVDDNSTGGDDSVGDDSSSDDGSDLNVDDSDLCDLSDDHGAECTPKDDESLTEEDCATDPSLCYSDDQGKDSADDQMDDNSDSGTDDSADDQMDDNSDSGTDDSADDSADDDSPDDDGNA